jgi:hypothetical protein
VTVVVDTNVLLVADQRHEDVSPECVEACALHLQKIMRSGRIALDDGFRILKEYQGQIGSGGPKGPGGAFMKWSLQNWANTECCDAVTINEHSDRGFEEFPVDNRLRHFDASDRKFVAVVAAHKGHPPILQASDSRWLAWAPQLESHGLTVEFLCRSDIERFQRRRRRG